MPAQPVELPDYMQAQAEIAALDLPYSLAEIHGIFAAFLSVGAYPSGESFVRALIPHETTEATRIATRAIFQIFVTTYQQIAQSEYTFELLLPTENTPLMKRAEAFSEWCQGFTQGLVIAQFEMDNIMDQDIREALLHVADFAELDYANLEASETDESAFMEVYEYTKVTVLHLYHDFLNRTHSENDVQRH